MWRATISSKSISRAPKPLVLVKWGGSLITDKTKPGHAREGVIERLCGELKQGLEAAPEVGVVLGHGSGSFGHAAAARVGMTGAAAGRRLEDADLRGAMEVRLEAARLHAMVSRSLLDAGLPTWTWAPSTALTAEGGRPRQGDLRAFFAALDQGLLPVTYGDVVVDTRLGASIASTEALMRFLVARLRRRRMPVARLLWMGETSGIYDHQGRTIPRIDRGNLRQAQKMIRAPSGIDVTGGMLLRLRTAWELARLGLDSWILDGTVPGLFAAALRGEEVPGTHVMAVG